MPLLETLGEILTKREQRSNRRRLTITSSNAVDFSSNDFLSLSRSQQFRKTFHEELARTNEFPLGSGGSRLLDGNSTYAEQLEKDIALFHNAPAGLLFNSGYDANSGFFSCVPQPGDVIVYDELIHASVHEGMRLARVKKRTMFCHNNVASLESALQRLVENDKALLSGLSNVFVAVETVYSMDGDVAPLKAILEVIQRVLPKRNGHLIVDEAHSTGVYGENGRGLVSELGLEDQILSRLHTFGKALSCNGAIILCPPILREYLINYARSLIYTTAMSTPNLALIRAAYTMLWDGHTQDAQRKLWALVEQLHRGLNQLPRSRLVHVSATKPESPIFAVLSPQPRDLAKFLQERDFNIRPIVPPTVPEGTARVRICVHSGNTEADIDRLVACIRQWMAGQEDVIGARVVVQERSLL